MKTVCWLARMSDCAAVFDGTGFTCFTGTKVQILTELLQPGSALLPLNPLPPTLQEPGMRREGGGGVTKVGGGRMGRAENLQKSGGRRWKLKRRGFGAKVSANSRRKSKGLQVN